jgi:hypothetical protein
MRKSIFISLLLVFISGLVGVKALLHSGFYTSHDGEHQLVRQYVLDQGLGDGQIPVRFSRKLYNGYGYPLFVFTYRLPFYAGEVFRLAGFSFADSIKAVFLIGYILSGLTMFWFARRWGNFAGVGAAILYMWPPYRFSVMFVRAALGEHTAAYYLAPAAAYRGLTQKLNPNYFADHFVTLKQLVYSPWGYTFSMMGTENDGMSFQIGIAQWLAVGIAIIVIIVLRLKRSLLGVRQGDSLIDTTSLLIIFLLSIFLMTEKSAFIWSWWKNYINIDMPWRFLLMTTFASSALAAIFLKGVFLKVPPSRLRRWHLC